jgi:hypothetical protein
MLVDDVHILLDALLLGKLQHFFKHLVAAFYNVTILFVTNFWYQAYNWLKMLSF